MPRRDRRVITYNLNSAAVQAAFEDGDADFDLDDAIRSRGGGPAAANPLKARNARSGSGLAFPDRGTLGQGAMALRNYGSSQRTQDVINLLEVCMLCLELSSAFL